MDVLTTPKGDLHLRARSLIGEVDPGGDERETTLLGAADQALDLAAVQQQLPRAFGIVVVAGGGAIRRDVHPDQPHLAATDYRVRVLQLRPGLAQRLNFRSRQHDPALEPLQQVVTEGRLPVGGDVAGRHLALASLGHQ